MSKIFTSYFCDFCMISAKFPKNFDPKNAEKCPFLSVFRCFFCVCIRKCLIINEKKFNIFAKIILKSVAQFKKMLYLYNVKEKQILTIKTKRIEIF